ncbi:hypothetical protein HN51_050607 [Arachis hypogaea]|nr:pentatricopeptide repeat-containing protein At3g49740 [Arachis ipaensis]XP_016166842.1 pentatricopeptide repeat-containing protein At3g49740 [Arachis ipaensis]XP_020963218.1 pentatricopeptide repeat-containing protein At3g49740 [Arachis ipaensis]XP_025665923.1 pentatricopeptide repeat-containing protein At3g49740 isoform X1 [Arachis hypogaea]XP_025665924.1 pentatricopeptide repeat-containing protein At3g49740 isoform X1 [Arachis hypogaea]QHN92377.1 Pentatricopeptide repeat-containing protei
MKPWFSQQIFIHTFSKDQPLNIFKLNRILAEFTRSNQYTESFKLFTKIHSSQSLRPDNYTLSTAITTSANSQNLTFGNQLHTHAIQTGLKSHSHVSNSLLSLYSKVHDLHSVMCVFEEIQFPDVYSWTTLLSACTRLDHVDYALQVFDQMPNRNNVATWNAIITGCTDDNGHEDFAISLFKDMHRIGIRPDGYTFASMLSLCKSVELLDYGRLVHSEVVKSGFLARTSVVNSLITMYFNCERVADAYEVFEEAGAALRDHITYNSMIDGLVKMERNEDAFSTFKDMLQAYLRPTELTFVSVMSSSLPLGFGCQAQALAIKMGFIDFTAVNNATMTMYSGFRNLNEVENIFESMNERDLVSWNIMISSYAQDDISKAAIMTYLKMRRATIEPDEFTYGSVLAAADTSHTVEMIHSLLLKNGLMKVEVLNALISAYSRHGNIKCAFLIFSDLPYKNLISWNSIISGLAINGYLLQGFEQFSALLDTNLKPNVYTLSLGLSICSSISAMSHGKQIHCYILRHGFSSEVSLGNALVTLYAKCGSLGMSLGVFNAMIERDTISWNALISAYGQHGLGEEAVCCFESMQTSPGIKPDHATFTAVLSACSHAGLVEEGTHMFYTMVKIYGFLPSVDHFSCVVDLLGRSGYLDEAERVIEGGYFGAHSDLCWSLFSACAAHGNLRLGRRIAKLLLERDHNNPSVSVLLSNIYAAAGQWEEAARLRDVMRAFGNTKQPGCSWIRA